MVIGIIFAYNILEWLIRKRDCRANTTLTSAGFLSMSYTRFFVGQ